MSFESIIEISPKDQYLIKSIGQECFYPSTTNLIYYGHVPMAAYYLLKGTLNIKNTKNQILKIIKKGALIGLHENLNYIGLPYAVEIVAGSSVIIINRTSMLSSLENENTPLSKLLMANV